MGLLLSIILSSASSRLPPLAPQLAPATAARWPWDTIARPPAAAPPARRCRTMKKAAPATTATAATAAIATGSVEEEAPEAADGEPAARPSDAPFEVVGEAVGEGEGGAARDTDGVAVLDEAPPEGDGFRVAVVAEPPGVAEAAESDAEGVLELLAVFDGERLFVGVMLTVEVTEGVTLRDAPVLIDGVGVGVADEVLLPVAEGVGVCVTAVGSTTHGAPV